MIKGVPTKPQIFVYKRGGSTHAIKGGGGLKNKIQIFKRLFQGKSSRFILPPLFSSGLPLIGPAGSGTPPI